MYQRKLFYFCVLIGLWESSNAYKNIRLQDYLCADKLIIALQKPFRGDPHFTLTEDRESAAVITQVWNSTVPGFFLSNKLKYDCNFKVQTPDRPPRGLYIHITRLKFRSDPETGACLDYIQFSSGNAPSSERKCNDISIDGPAGRFISDHRDRDVKVHIHIDKRKMIQEPLELTMVLTSHTECNFMGDFQCDPKDPYSCISRHFVRDNIINCMWPCRDEISCLHDGMPSEEIDTTNVALSAITSLIFTMLGVGFCVWLCWKYWNCITVQQHAHEASATARRTARATHSLDTPTIELPAAPVYDFNEEQQHQSSLPTPKDLPPSYESLFPER